MEAHLPKGSKLLISINAEGGSIAVYGSTDDPEHTRYRVMVVDDTPTMLNDDEGGLSIRKDSGWLSTWSEMIAVLDRYPWPHLSCRHVDASVAAAVWSVLNDHGRRTGRPVDAERLKRWRGACRS